MSRKHHELEGAGGGGVGSVSDTDDANGEAMWDTGSSLFDSYELAAVRRLLDKRLLAAAGVLALLDEPPPATGETRGKSTQVVPAVSRVHVHHRKVTLRALFFRAVSTWTAARPRQAPPLTCACAGMVHDRSGGAAVEHDVPSHGQL